MDPFSDIEGVVHVKEVNTNASTLIPQSFTETEINRGLHPPPTSNDLTATNSLAIPQEAVKKAKRISPFGPKNPFIRSISTTFSVELQDKARQDLENRIDSEKAIHETLTELHAIRERLYQLRFDRSRPSEDICRDVENLLKEMSRLEDALNRVREKSLAEYLDSLKLNELKIDPEPAFGRHTAVKKIDLTVRPATISTSSAATTNQPRPIQPNLLTPTKISKPADDDDVEAEPLMRTKSTHTLKDKPATEKWHGLYRMFREWKHHKQVAEATHVMRSESPLATEISKLRAGIYSLRQRKQLSASDEELLKILTAKLRALCSLEK